MSDEARLDRSRQWFDAAFDELRASKTLLYTGHYAQSCFYAQQSVEKAMKGIMAADGKADLCCAIAAGQASPDATAAATSASIILFSIFFIASSDIR